MTYACTYHRRIYPSASVLRFTRARVPRARRMADDSSGFRSRLVGEESAVEVPGCFQPFPTNRSLDLPAAGVNRFGEVSQNVTNEFFVMF